MIIQTVCESGHKSPSDAKDDDPYRCEAVGRSQLYDSGPCKQAEDAVPNYAEETLHSQPSGSTITP